MVNKKNNNKRLTIRSSTAEYLTFIAANGENSESVEMRYEDENIWLTQKLMATLYDVEVHTVNYHIKKIFDDKELTPEATIRKFRIVQTEGNRQVEREMEHYNLHMIIAVGFKVNNERAVRFRKWANIVLKDYTIQGWAMDADRLKNFGTILTKDYFEKQLEKIREIRLSERRFYQKVTDIYATALDYDPTAETTELFFKKVQNKLHWAIHQHTAAELIVARADSNKTDMGLTSWEESPLGKIKKSDVIIAKNYLSETELKELELIVSGYLDFAENMAKRHIPMTMQDWATQLDQILIANKYELLDNAGKIAMEVAKQHAITEWEKYRIIQDKLYESDFDRFLQLENNVKKSDEKNHKQ
ncbi:MAG: virulence RhuM family protein [Planctomycetaceae bacterium]|nr:virulence RhuM family protein [Planctomycetaceae bacterium]